MKNVWLMIALFAICLTANSQDPNLGKYFQFTGNVSLNHCNAVGVIPAPVTSDIISQGIQFKIVALAGADYVIFVLKDESDAPFTGRFYNALYLGAAAPPPNTPPAIFFLLPNATFKAICKPRLTRNSFTLGVVNLPLKMRFGSKDKVDGLYDRHFLLSSDVSLGFSIGYKHKWSDDWGINLLGGLSLCSVQVDSSTTKGVSKSSGNASGVTSHIGLLFEVDNFQFGMFTGVDYLTGDIGKSWIYRNRPWLGIAIGYSIFKTKSSKDEQ